MQEGFESIVFMYFIFPILLGNFYPSYGKVRYGTVPYLTVLQCIVRYLYRTVRYGTGYRYRTVRYGRVEITNYTNNPEYRTIRYVGTVRRYANVAYGTVSVPIRYGTVPYGTGTVSRRL
jgi:hypothetical protein